MGRRPRRPMQARKRRKQNPPLAKYVYRGFRRGGDFLRPTGGAFDFLVKAPFRSPPEGLPKSRGRGRPQDAETTSLRSDVRSEFGYRNRRSPTVASRLQGAA